MKTFLVYLAGPITGLKYDTATGWRERVRDTVPKYIKTLSPMRGKKDLKRVESDSTIKDAYPETHLASYKGINARDYFDVQRCDVLFVNLSGTDKVSIGTVMEIAWARAFDKPVILVMEKGNIHTHSMLLFPCGFVVETLEEGLEVLKHVLGPDDALEENEFTI